jgi:uracil-DNA glycosylase
VATTTTARYASPMPDLAASMPSSWRSLLGDLLESEWFAELGRFVDEERLRGAVYPPHEEVFAALARTEPSAVRVVLVGQDPYHGPGQAHGLAFSVRRGVPRPPSLVNVHKELAADLGHPIPSHGSLEAWADRGVLLLNTVLTVREGSAGSHAGRGWERVTDAILARLADGARPIVFVLWGTHAQKKASLVERAPHVVLRGVHPSPLSAHRGFVGSRPFSAIDEALRQFGEPPLDWRVTD